jgi:hypothetical protein
MPSARLELADEPDEIERELDTVRRELAAAKNAAPKLRVTFADGPHLSLDARLVTPLEPATHHKLLADWRELHPHISGTPDFISIPGVGRIDLPRGIGGHVSKADAQPTTRP